MSETVKGGGKGWSLCCACRNRGNRKKGKKTQMEDQFLYRVIFSKVQ